MKNFIQTIRNIFKIEELRNRILLTLGLVAIYRLGTYIVLPGIDPEGLQAYASRTEQGLLSLIDMFAGGAFSRASIFALGIMPYITASIIMQVLGIAVPAIQKMQREGESGRQKLNQYTRLATIAITAVQAVAFLFNLESEVGGAILPIAHPGSIPYWLYMFTNVGLLITGTMFVMWLGEKITDRGIGNGISLIIMIGIIARLPVALLGELELRMSPDGGGPVMFLVELVFLLFVVVAVVALVQATRRIPINYAKRIVGNKQYGGTRNFLPLKLNAAGVMPIIFAQAIMFIPSQIAQFFAASPTWSGLSGALVDYTSLPYNLIMSFLIILFTYFYTAVTINSNQIADDLKRNNGFIPGVKPGKATAEYIDTIMSRITLPGAAFLALVAAFPAVAIIFGINPAFASFYGGTSLLIMVGVVLDTLQQIESHLLMRHYDGLTKGGRIKGRAGNLAGVGS